MLDLEKHKADMAMARDAGITFQAIRDIMNAHADDGPDGESFGRMVERIRELTLQAAERMVAEERAATAECLRAVGKLLSEDSIDLQVIDDNGYDNTKEKA